jgi:hypothetical protein
MRGKGSIPGELLEAVRILEARPVRQPGEASEVDMSLYDKKKALIERLLLREWEKMVPFPAGESKSKHSEAYQWLFQNRPDLFEPQSIPGNSTRQRLDANKQLERRDQEAHRLLDDWLRAWIDRGKSAALLMFARQDIENAIKKWWHHPKRFIWPLYPGTSAVTMHAERKVTAEFLACRAMWTILTHPNGERFNRCEKCGRIYYALSDRAYKRFCDRSCGGLNSLKPYKVNPEGQKLEVARKLLQQAKGVNWKAWVASQQEATYVGITSHWLSRRINEEKLMLPETLKGVR